MEETTIAAISTAMSASGIGIVRISGPEAFEIASRVYRSKGGKKSLKNVPSHTIHYGYIYDNEEMVDEVLVMAMRGPRTYTGEDTIEIDCHGGVLAMKKVLETVLKNGAIIAEPGEFTKRAFLNGRIDLSQAEAVMDVIQSKNEYSLKNSVGQLKGSVRKTVQKIREKLLRSGNIYAVIGLPANLFYNTSIPTCIIVLKKHRDGRDVLFIDASKKFNKGKKQNEMTDEHIEAVMELYSKRENVEKESFLASFEDIEKNDFNLNIPRYVDTFEKEPEIDLDEVLKEMEQTNKEIEQAEGEFLSLLKELTSPDEKIMASLNDLIKKMER